MSASNGQLLASSTSGALLYRALDGALLYSIAGAIRLPEVGSLHSGYHTGQYKNNAASRAEIAAIVWQRVEDDFLAATGSTWAVATGIHAANGTYFSPYFRQTYVSGQYDQVPQAAALFLRNNGVYHIYSAAACGVMRRFDCTGLVGLSASVSVDGLSSVPSEFSAFALAISASAGWPSTADLLSAPLSAQGGSSGALGSLAVTSAASHVVVALIPTSFPATTVVNSSTSYGLSATVS